MGGKADGIFSGVRTVWAVGPSPRQGSGFADAVRSPQLLNTQMEDKGRLRGDCGLLQASVAVT